MSKTILVVEDYDDSREFLRLLLEMNGYRVIEAVTGSEAVEQATKEVPDLILMDLGLPVLDGVAATILIKGVAALASIPIIAVTAHTSRYFQDALAAGCETIIEKPIDIETLKPVLESLLPS